MKLEFVAMLIFFAGVLACFGVVGTLEIEPNPNMPALAVITTVGLLAMAFSVKYIREIE